MFAETLYKTAAPREAIVPAEFYELGFDTVRAAGKTEYRVIEIHGWWDDNKKLFSPGIISGSGCEPDI
jgi:hypothetical protein